MPEKRKCIDDLVYVAKFEMNQELWSEAEHTLEIAKKKAAVIKDKERTNLILDLLKKTRAKEKNSLP